jgi:hypothetical protein
MDLTTQALNQAAKDQLTLVQQLAVTSDLVAQLAAERRAPGGNHATGGHPGNHQNGGPHRVNRGVPDPPGQEEEVPLHRSALPKLSFPKFSGTNPMIWIDKCVDYFKIFNILDHMWTTVASLHMEDNATKWLQVYKMK